MNEHQKNGFVAIEYKEINVRRSMETVYSDAYPSFGWQLEGTTPSLSVATVNLKFKRNRRFPNKSEISRLQREFENQTKQIEKMEISKAIAPSLGAYGIGFVGVAFTVGAVCSYLAKMLPLCIVLSIPALVGWIVPYFAYRKIAQKNDEKVSPIIDQQYDAIFEICEKANELLYA